MIYTSYFGKLKALPDDVIPISICAKAPSWYTGNQYKKLAPQYGSFMKWKENQDNDYYRKCFKEEVTDLLIAEAVIEELYEMIPRERKMLLEGVNCPPWQNPMISICLVCCEKPDDFCHRDLVADWLNESGFNVMEWQ